MSDLRTAAQQVLEAWDGDEIEWFKRSYTVMENLRAALAQQAEPVAGVVLNEEGRAALVEHGREEWHCVSRNARRLYTAPPQRKPLTEEEIESCRQKGYAHAGLGAPFDFGKAARAVERAVWEKNHG